LLIQNRGMGPAFGVRFEFDSVPTNYDHKRLDELAVFKHGIAVLQAGQRHAPLIYTFGPRIQELGTPTQFSVTAKYSDASGRPYTCVSPIDLESYMSSQLPSATVEESLAEISKKLKS
jgi:hypothetical protein